MCFPYLCKDLGFDRLADDAYGAVINNRTAGGVQFYIMLRARSAHSLTHSLTYLNVQLLLYQGSCRCMPVSCKLYVHIQKACKPLLG